MTGVGLADINYNPYDYEIDRNPHPIWKRMRDEAPLYWNEQYGFWALSRFADVSAAYQDTVTFSSKYGISLDMLEQRIELPSMIFMDPPAHDSLRKLVSRGFTPRRINELEQSIATLVDGYLDEFIGADSFDYVAEFGALVPPIVIGALLGVPEEDRHQLRLWFDDMMHHEEGSRGPSERAGQAMFEVMQYTLGMLPKRRANPQDDLITALLEAEVDDGDGLRKLDDTEVSSFVLLLAGAGVETVARLLSWAAVTLARNPDQRSLLVRDPSLTPQAIEELLRYEAPSPVNGRWVTRPYQVHGVTIPADSKILLINASANRDSREFDDGDRFLVLREPKRHISFGIGPHFCLGAALARMEGRIALEATLKRFPSWTIDESELVPVHTTTVRGFRSVPIHLG